MKKERAFEDGEEWFLGKDSVRKFRQLTSPKLLPVSERRYLIS